MFKPLRKTNPLIKIINSTLIDLPAPMNISILWNYGSLLGLCLVIQIITGLFLSMHYTPNTEMAFSSIIHITRDVNYGWLLRSIHTNGASLFFMCLYIHVARGIYYSSFILQEVWNIGVIMLIMTMATAFVGYVLPWGQMSFWGATVITNLLSAIPYIGKSMVEWIWGSFTVDNATLNRFFIFHFILPFILIMLTMIHIMFLHQTGSNNPLGLNSNADRIQFHNYFSSKDLLGYTLMVMILLIITIYTPNLLTDPENFLKANSSMTPLHIKPEWYFLWAYAILRSIPNKLGGVIAMFSAFLILFILPMSFMQNKQPTSFYPLNQIMFWIFVSCMILLTWIGGRPVEHPFIMIGQLLTSLYFLYFITSQPLAKLWDKLFLN